MIFGQQYKRSGFTLVELSIVLVIIGLLIGGILVAQSMIGTAKIQKTVKEIQQIDIAFTNFQNQYGELPGDTDLFPNGGNNDGLIYWGEGLSVWEHLSLGEGLLNSKNANYSVMPSSAFTSDSCPQLSLDQKKDSYACLHVFYSNEAPGEMHYYFYEYLGSGGSTYDVFKPADILAIDTKIDDGDPNNGEVFGRSNEAETPYCTSGSNYNLTTSKFVCAMYYKVGINSN